MKVFGVGEESGSWRRLLLREDDWKWSWKMRMRVKEGKNGRSAMSSLYISGSKLPNPSCMKVTAILHTLNAVQTQGNATQPLIKLHHPNKPLPLPSPNAGSRFPHMHSARRDTEPRISSKGASHSGIVPSSTSSTERRRRTSDRSIPPPRTPCGGAVLRPTYRFWMPQEGIGWSLSGRAYFGVRGVGGGAASRA